VLLVKPFSRLRNPSAYPRFHFVKADPIYGIETTQDVVVVALVVRLLGGGEIVYTQSLGRFRT
jgi:hypothetical protein